MTDDERLEYTRVVLQAVLEHAIDGGSYRYLIYERLGFGPEAYGYLLDAGMPISNEFVILDENVGSCQDMVVELIEYIETHLNLKAPNQFRTSLLELGYSYDALLKDKMVHDEKIKRMQAEIDSLIAERNKSNQ